MIAVRFEEVWFRYGAAPLLQGVSFAVHRRETVALLGRNGSGKTTLTKLVMALLLPDRGFVRVGDRVTEGRSPEQIAARAGYVFQHVDQQLFARTVRDEVAFGPRQLGLPGREVERAVADALRKVGLDRVASAHPYDLPPAHRRLVALAAAIAHGPQVLVLDEPTQGFDAAGVERVLAVIRGLASEGVAILAATHDLAFVTEGFDRSLVLHDGRVGYDGPSIDLVTDPDHLQGLGLRIPVQVDFARRLGLPGTPIRRADVTAALRGYLSQP